MEKTENDAKFRGLFEGADLSGAQIIVNNENGGTVIYHNHAEPQADNLHLPLDGDKAEGRMVYRQLIEKGFIDKHTDENSFLFIMGYSSEANGTIGKVVWLKTKQLARELVTLRNQQVTAPMQLKKSMLGKLTEQYFEKDGQPLRLAKNKPVLSSDSDELKKILRPQATPC